MATATKSTASSRSTSSRAVQVRSGRHNPQKSSRKQHTTVPPPQSARIMARCVAGQSVARIAREEKRDRKTVTKIVRSEQMQHHVQQMREQYYGLAELAMDGLRRALAEKNDGRLAHEILRNLGVIPTAEDISLQRMRQPRPTTEADRVKLEMWKLLAGACERAEMYGHPKPCLEDFRTPLRLTGRNDDRKSHELE